MIIKTKEFAKALEKVKKAVGDNRILPITSYILLKEVEGKLQFLSTDTANFIKHTSSIDCEKDFQLIVNAEQLIKLVSKTTVDEITLTDKDNYVELKGNGTYKISKLDEDYIEYEPDNLVKEVKISVKKLLKLLSVNQVAIAKDSLVPCLEGFYINNYIATTDSYKMCYNSKADIGLNLLLSKKMFELISVLEGDIVIKQLENNNILITDDTTEIFGPQLNGYKDFPDITAFIDLEFDNQYKLNVSGLLDILDRATIFSGDNDGVSLTFSDNLVINDFNNKVNEQLPITVIKQEEEAKINLNLTNLINILKVIDNDFVFNVKKNSPLIIRNENTLLILADMERD